MSTFTRIILGAILAVISAAAFAHDGHLNDAPWSACEDQQIGDACTFENSAKDIYRGTCRAMSDALMCVRNQPIEKSESYADTALADD
ncbi:MAG: hypothetical protein WBM54_04945 [Woeseia sp.]